MLPQRYHVHSLPKALEQLQGKRAWEQLLFVYAVNPHDGFKEEGVLGFGFDTLQESLTCKAALASFICKDVSQNPAYTPKMLSLFGLPRHYACDLEHLYNRLDALGTTLFEWSFPSGMAADIAIKAQLYHHLIWLKKETHAFIHNHPKGLRRVQKRVGWIVSWLYLAQPIMDVTTMKRCAKRFETLLTWLKHEEKSTLKALLKTAEYEWIILDLGVILFEKSGFYTTHHLSLYALTHLPTKEKASKALHFLQKRLYM